MGKDNEECCDCGCECCGKGGKCECCCEEKKAPETMTGMAIDMGDKAWMAVIGRKMEAKLEKGMGKQMDKVATIMVEYAHKYYAASMKGKKLSQSETDAYEKKLNAAMM